MNDLYKGEIGIIQGVSVVETTTYIREKPVWFPSSWLWYTMAGWFTVQVTKARQ